MTTRRTAAGKADWLRTLCALSLVLIAFAHKPLDVSGKLDAYAGVDISAYVLPDGTLPDLCLTGEGEDPRHAADSRCEACRIAASVDLPPPVCGLEITGKTKNAPPSWSNGVTSPRQSLRPGAPPRAPPDLSYA